LLTGEKAGVNYSLDPGREILLGRGADCHVALADTLCSRVHARLVFRDGGWLLCDAQSRNGTFVNGQKVEEAMLGEGHVVRVGGSELEFRISDDPITAEGDEPGNLKQTIVQDISVEVQGPSQD